MIGLLCFVLTVLVSAFKSKSRPEAENAALRYQLIVLRRKVRSRPQLTNNDRWFFVQLYRWFPSILQVLTIIRPDTLVRWHQAGFRRYWHWKSRTRGGRPDRDRAARAVPAHERREPALGCDASSKTLGRVASSNGTGEWSEDPQSVEKPSSGACLKSPNATRVLPFLLDVISSALRGLR
jgi:hypothetical protein